VRPQEEREHAGSVRSQEAIPGSDPQEGGVCAEDGCDPRKSRSTPETSKTTFREDGGMGREAMRLRSDTW